MSGAAAFTSQELRRALGAFATGVTVVTAHTPDGVRLGVTVNSFNSVSMDPPLVLWSLARSSRSLEGFVGSQHWVVHVLAAHQEEVSRRFAQQGADKFTGLDVVAGPGGAPMLEGCSVRFHCRSAFQYDGGDHVIFVGEVIRIEHFDVAPLVFHSGRYAVATPKAEQLSLTTAQVAGRQLDASFSEDFLGYLLGRAHYQVYGMVRESIRRHGLSDDDYFVISVLSVRDGRTLENIRALVSFTGIEVTEDALRRLEARGLLEADCVDGSRTTWRLSPQGHDIAMQIILAAKAIESDLLGRLGGWEALSLKNLLKKLILQTNPGLPDLWDAT